MIEILIAALQNFVAIGFGIGIALVILGGVYTFFSSLNLVTSYSGSETESSIKHLLKAKRLIILGCCLCLIGIVPSVNDLWRVRVALIQLELSKPENVKATVQRIDEISKALECKYLDSCGDKTDGKWKEKK